LVCDFLGDKISTTTVITIRKDMVSEATYQRMLTEKYGPHATQPIPQNIICSSGGAPSSQNDKASDFPRATWP